MSIIVLTPPPKNPPGTNAASLDANPSVTDRLASEFLHLIGREGYHFDTFEQLRDFAQAQIDAAALSSGETPAA
jgi:hypothetical protein